MISTGPAQVQQYALVSLAKRGSWLLLAAQHNFSTASAQHQHLMSARQRILLTHLRWYKNAERDPTSPESR
uniref:Uncharacterized protein n=1 Tax=Caenorhabditis japonica TaxID=281687 RepID=A0A8R1E5X4_CAEJA